MDIQYVVEQVNTATLVATVLYFNPFHTGEHIEDNGDGTFTDNDPNPHVRKEISIPFRDGEIDMVKFTQRLEDHRRTISRRMVLDNRETNRPADPNVLNALVGLVSTSGEG